MVHIPANFLSHSSRVRARTTLLSRVFCLHCLHRLTQNHEVRGMAVKAKLPFAFTHKQEIISALATK